MKIAHRLYLTVLPAILGVLTVAGLAYWGQYAHAVPHLLLVIAAIGTIGSLALSWVNARYVAHRIERLAHPAGMDGLGSSLKGVASVLLPGHVATQPDELDTIEGVVDHLSTAVAVAEAARTERERAFAQRTRDYASMLATVAAGSARQLEDVRLPLHILLENHFGDLNENQEEMLGAARAAAEAADADLVALRQIAELDLGVRELRQDRLFPGDLIRALMPMLQATAEQAHVVLRIDLEPLVPAIRGDQPQLQDALATLFGGAIRATGAGTEVTLTMARVSDAVLMTLQGATREEQTARGMLASRTIAASGGTIGWDGETLTITFRSG